MDLSGVLPSGGPEPGATWVRLAEQAVYVARWLRDRIGAKAPPILNSPRIAPIPIVLLALAMAGDVGAQVQPPESAPGQVADEALAARVKTYIEPLRERIALELEFVSNVCEPSEEQAAALRETLDGEIDILAKETAVILRRNPGQERAFVDGKAIDFPTGLDRELVTAPAELAHRMVAQALKADPPDTWRGLDAEHGRLDMRRKRAAVLAQVALLDEALLLSSGQRKEFCKRLDDSTDDNWWRPATENAMLDPAVELLHAALAGGVLGTLYVPGTELTNLLHPAQRAIYEDVTRLRRVEIARRAKPAANMVPAKMARLQRVAAMQGPAKVRSMPFEERLRQLTCYVQRQVAGVDAGCGLTKLQRDKLLLAGKLDIERFAERASPAHEKPQAGQDVRLVRLAADVSDAGLSLAVFGQEESCFRRALHNCLDEDQKQKLARARCDRREFHRRALVEAAVAGFARAAVLTSWQCEDLSRALNGELEERDGYAAGDWRVKYLQATAQFPEELLGLLLPDVHRRAAVRHQAQIAEAARQFAAQAAGDEAPGRDAVELSLLAD